MSRQRAFCAPPDARHNRGGNGTLRAMSFRTVSCLATLLFAVCGLAAAPEKLPEDRIAQLRRDQPQRLEAALSRLAGGAGTAPRVFFVGFAGFGEEKVFAEEISLVAKRVAERYGGRDRQVLLVNDRRAYDAHPFATAGSLAAVLAGVGELMNAERDILFLALSTHGTRDGKLVVSNPDLFLELIGGKELAAMLEAAGIRNRVIIVSACFSGQLIKPLKNERTVIVTAAAKNRSSFGCSDDRDLTYFGEAFWRDAFPRAANLREAYEVARAAITEREKFENFYPSNPQAWFGKVLEGRLEGVERAPRVN
jgi:hypothetical protein